jgi:SAM-dependent methyltransferase
LDNEQVTRNIMDCIKAGMFKDALTCSLEVLETTPDDPNTLHLFGIAAINAGRIDLAIIVLSRALTRNPALAGEMDGALRTTLLALSQAAFLLDSPSQTKHLWRWLASLRKDYLLDEPSPWITFDAIDFINSRIRTGMTIFEYGSGGSTLYWLKHDPQLLVTVEHDPAWHAVLKERIDASDRIDLRLVCPDATRETDADPADPDGYSSGSPSHSRLNFEQYARQIDDFPDDFFDIILIDGRARPSCIKHAHQKVRPGGLLVIDNSDRDYYLERSEAYLLSYEVTKFSGAIPGVHHMISTTIAVRNPHS